MVTSMERAVVNNKKLTILYNRREEKIAIHLYGWTGNALSRHGEWKPICCVRRQDWLIDACEQNKIINAVYFLLENIFS